MIKSDFYGFVPIVAVTVGAVIGTKIKMPDVARSVLLATSAGLVTASLFSEIVPQVNSAEDGGIGKKVAAVAGILGGALLMLGLKQFDTTAGVYPKAGKIAPFPIALVGATAADFFIDNLVIGQSLHSTPTLGLVVASGIESIIVTSSIVNMMKSNGNSETQIAIASVTLVAASIGGLLAGHYLGQTMGDTTKTALMGVAMSVILWVVVMELWPAALNAGKKKWWVPAIILGTTGFGYILNWTMD
jgi:zinc transporter ZupT